VVGGREPLVFEHMVIRYTICIGGVGRGVEVCMREPLVFELLFECMIM